MGTLTGLLMFDTPYLFSWSNYLKILEFQIALGSYNFYVTDAGAALKSRLNIFKPFLIVAVRLKTIFNVLIDRNIVLFCP